MATPKACLRERLDMNNNTMCTVTPFHKFLGGGKIFYEVGNKFLQRHAINPVSSPTILKSIQVLKGTKVWYACTY